MYYIDTINMEYFLLSFIAGVLTVFAPCVFTLLPVILAGTLQSSKTKRALTIIISLSVSVFFFTLILKASTLLITVPQQFWNILSGGIILAFGIFTLFPEAWTAISAKFKLQNKSDEMLSTAAAREDTAGNILIGAALGPVFSSCSPTYAIIVASILPLNFASGIANLLIYVFGMAITLLLVTIFGQKIIHKLGWAVNPNGIFKKILGIIFIIIGIFIITGIDKQIQTYLLDQGFLDETQIETNLLKSNDMPASTSSVKLNVEQPYPAPEFAGIDTWLNSQPLKISDLKGKVVLVDFWTYTCINCIRTLPYVKEWYNKYKDDGFIVIGVHAPEFSFEKLTPNVEQFIKDNDIQYPVAQDNNLQTWQAYNNQYWPAEYLIDREGQVRHTHFGEGNYDETEEAIQYLLGLNIGSNLGNIKVPVTSGQSPETYLGYNRGTNFGNNIKQFTPDSTATYTLNNNLDSNQWSIGGEWNITSENAETKSDGAELSYKFSAKDVYLVMGAESPTKVTVKINGKVVDETNKGNDVNSDGYITVSDQRLYRLVSLSEFKRNMILNLTFDKGVKLNAFTFGS